MPLPNPAEPPSQRDDRSATPPTALIVTLAMDSEAAARFTAMRRAHFPPERNWLDAHITLFHALPMEAEDRVVHDVRALAAAIPAFDLAVDRLLFLGGGVAYGLTSPDATQLRRTLADRWASLLGRQDSRWHGRLHVTVQNKVPPAQARQLLKTLEHDFVPHPVGAVGVQVWHYLGGPWRLVAACPFGGSAR